MNFKEFDFSTEVEPKKVTIKGKEVKVLQYLPIQKKMDLIQIALQESEEDPGVFNPIKLSILMDLYIILFYTDIEIDDEDKQDFFKLYDILEVNNVFNIVIDNIPDEEYSELQEYVELQQNEWGEYRKSVVYLLKGIIDSLPDKMKEVSDILNSFDPSKYQAVIDFATAANGGRPIPQSK